MLTATASGSPQRAFSSVLDKYGLPAPVSSALERILKLDRLDDLYSRVTSTSDGRPRFERLLELLNVRVEVAPADLAQIPGKGPVLLVANHPFGFIEGGILAAILPRIRPDVRIMA